MRQKRFQKWMLGVLLGLFILPTLSWGKNMEVRSTEALKEIPILHEGRVKPLDTFARVHLLTFSGRSTLKDQSAMDWLMEVLFDPMTAFQRRLFKIRSSDVIETLNLPERSDHRYSFHELSSTLQQISPMLNALHHQEKEARTPSQNQLLEVYFKTVRYYEISRSFSPFLSLFWVESPELARQLGVEVGINYTYLEISKFRPQLQKALSSLKGGHGELTEFQQDSIRLFHDMMKVEEETESGIFRVIPPQWKEDGAEWFSPWAVFHLGKGSPQTAGMIQAWRDLAGSYAQGGASWDTAAQKLRSLSPDLLKLEVLYNEWSVFGKALALYVLSFLLLATSWIFIGRVASRLQTASFVSLLTAGGLHLLGVVWRIIIMQRPPVSTLYESIIFVSLIAVIFGIILECVRKDNIGILIATVIGALLHFVALGYTDDGDTMGMLVAVLNTNFWLATHVVTITIGYGCCFVGGVIGHIYLIKRLIDPSNTAKLTEIYRNMVGVSLFALFFALFGTILGGIWADQSWGRFWGWDPKENGALLIVLWLLWLLHGILTDYVKNLGFALGMVVTNIVVALAWFGVNLLNVGLHSYGFTDSAFLNLALFCVLELLFGLTFYFWIRLREKQS